MPSLQLWAQEHALRLKYPVLRDMHATAMKASSPCSHEGEQARSGTHIEHMHVSDPHCLLGLDGTGNGCCICIVALPVSKHVEVPPRDARMPWSAPAGLGTPESELLVHMVHLNQE